MTDELTTAVVNVAPSIDPTVIKLRDEVQKLLAYSQERKVASVQDAESATNDLSIISQLKKTLEEKRKEYLQPLRDYTSNINDAFKLISDPLNEADRITRDKVLAFKQYQEQLRREAEEAARLQREADEAARKVREATGEIMPERTEANVIVPEVSKHVHADLGTTGMITIKKWEVSDFALVPDKYKEPNSKLIGSVVRAGGEIPGIRIWEEQTLRVTAKGE